MLFRSVTNVCSLLMSHARVRCWDGRHGLGLTSASDGCTTGLSPIRICFANPRTPLPLGAIRWERQGAAATGRGALYPPPVAMGERQGGEGFSTAKGGARPSPATGGALSSPPAATRLHSADTAKRHVLHQGRWAWRRKTLGYPRTSVRLIGHLARENDPPSQRTGAVMSRMSPAVSHCGGREAPGRRQGSAIHATRVTTA